MGDRLSQTVGITTTRYVLDPGAGLTQVLSDGTNTYLYGPSTASGSAQGGRLAQYQAAMQYFGADGLGSVRQLFDASGQVLANNRYDPFGSVISQSGVTSVFAFAGEQYDAATGLEYLRARYYSSAQGRFTTRDVWEGDPTSPMSYNGWLYAYGNSVNLTDPSGQVPLAPPNRRSCGCGLLGGGCEQFKGTPFYEPCKWIVSLFGSQTGAGQGGEGSAPTPEPTLPPTSTPTLPPTPVPPTPTLWEQQYGGKIANAALQIVSDRARYYIWGGGGRADENYSYPPPPIEPSAGAMWGSIKVRERTGGRIPVVCADVVAMSYARGGLPLSRYADWYSNPERYPKITPADRAKGINPTRSVGALRDLVQLQGKLFRWGDGSGAIPELGDMIFLNDFSHSGVIVGKSGLGATQIFLADANFEADELQRESLDGWITRHPGNGPSPYFGHPRP